MTPAPHVAPTPSEALRALRNRSWRAGVAHPRPATTPEAEAILGEWIDARQSCFGCPDKCEATLSNRGTCGYKAKARAGIRPACPAGRF